MLYYNNKKYLNINEWVKYLNASYGKYGIKVQARDVHQLFHHYHLKPLKTNSKREISSDGNITWFSVSSFNTVRFKEEFMEVLGNIVQFGDAQGEKGLNLMTTSNDIDTTYRNDENDMDKHSQYLEKIYQTEDKKNFKTIIINEEALRKIVENFEDEGFATRNGEFSFIPNVSRKADTNIFNKETNDLKVRKVLLPKSQVISYNLYDIQSMDVNRSLKHKIDKNGNPIKWFDTNPTLGNKKYSNSITHFINRSVLLMRHIIGTSNVDYITYPQSSSEFNNLITNKLLETYPQSKGIKLIPQMLVKNVRGIFVNVRIAKEIGLQDSEINFLQQRVEKWKKDEDIRDLRREIEILKKEVEAILLQKKRGRPSKELTTKRDLINLNKQKIKLLKSRGRDSTIDNEGNVKDFQIKSLDDRDRRAIEGLFTLNPQYLSLKDKLKGKTVILFDDNLSSGATMDDLCLLLKQFQVEHIIPITLGVISPTIYKISDRNKIKGI